MNPGDISDYTEFELLAKAEYPCSDYPDRYIRRLYDPRCSYLATPLQ